MIKLVVFDWNGTLIADTHACMDADNSVLKVYGGRPVNLQEYRKTIVIPAIEFFVKNGVDRTRLIRDAKEVSKSFHTFYESRAAKVRTRNGARKLLAWLFKNKIETMILSNHSAIGIEKQLGRLGLRKYFSHVFANSNLATALQGQNKREKLTAFLRGNSASSAETIIIGDSPEEVEIGKYTGIKTVAIKNGYYSTQRLKESNPDYLIGNLNQLIGIIEKLR